MKYFLALSLLLTPYVAFSKEAQKMNLVNLKNQQELVNFSKSNKTYVIQVMASWCASCSGALSKLLEAIPKGNKKITVLAVSVDDDLEAFKIYHKKNQNKWNTSDKDVRFLLDKEGQNLKSLSLKAIPSTFIIRNKIVLKSISGDHNMSIINDFLKTSH